MGFGKVFEGSLPINTSFMVSLFRHPQAEVDEVADHFLT